MNSSAGMDDMTPAEKAEFKRFCDELGQVGKRHNLGKERLIQGFLYFGVRLADRFDKEYEIEGTEVRVYDA